jgi:GDP-4-dehydro-6-deoxy-D-mannose reductase
VKTILVTGATGAFGQVVVEYINTFNTFQTISLTRDHSKKTTGKTVYCDLCDIKQISTTLESIRPDYILHLAATLTNSLEEAYKINVQSAQQLLDFVEKNRLNNRVVLIGSAAEYGVVQPDESPIYENHVLFPVSVYGLSKAWQTQLLGLYASRGVDVVCARVFNLFGKGLSNKLFAGRLDSQIQEVLAGQKNTIEVGALTAIRDYISMDKAACQLIDIMQYGKTGEIYHIASGIPVTMYDFMRLQLKRYGLDESLIRISPESSNRQGYDVPVIYAHIEKTKALGCNS